MRGRIVRRLPPIARRDRLIAQLKADRAELDGERQQLIDERDVLLGEHDRLRADHHVLRGEHKALRGEHEALRGDLRSPSFNVKHLEARRVRALIGQLGASVPVMKVNAKDAGYRFARGHGIATPIELASCFSPEDIDWTSLPDAFVIKTLEGTASRGVFPMQREGTKYRDLLAPDAGLLSEKDIVLQLENRFERGFVSRQLVIEELLPSPYDFALPIVPDVKLYCFYGTVGMIMVAARRSRKPGGLTFRYFDVDGNDIGNVRAGRPFDPTLPAPLHLEPLIDAGQRLSAALPEPFIRLDFYERVDGIVFGETTLDPGGDQTMTPDVDRALGALWEAAEARLRVEAIAAGQHEPRFATLS